MDNIIASALVQAAHRVESRVEKVLAGVGLSNAKFEALSVLVSQDQPMSLSELAAKLVCVKSNVTQLVDRLEAEGCVARDRTKWPHHYSAVLKRADLAEKRLQEAADELFEGDLAPLLSHLVRSQRLTARDREDLRKLLDELDRMSKGKNGQ